MWLVTTAGFYSIVEKPWDRPAGTLTVRARVRADLERFLAIAQAAAPIAEDQKADYRFRAQLPAATVMAVAAKLVQEIDYANFKDAVGERQGLDRAAVYARVWAELRGLINVRGPWIRWTGSMRE